MARRTKERITWQASATALDEEGGVVTLWCDRWPRLQGAIPSDSCKGQVRVKLDEGGGRAVWVRIGYADGLSPSELQRFPWARFFALADAARRGLTDSASPDESKHLPAVFQANLQGRPLPRLPRVAKRPGRRGHPDSFYKAVAQQYSELRASGHYNPTDLIAKRRHVSRNTVAGWVSTARKRGYLPPARPGRAG